MIATPSRITCTNDRERVFRRLECFSSAIKCRSGKREKWDVSGPHFGGWEIYHAKGSPVDPNRLYASQSSGWFGQVMQRSDDGGKTWATPDGSALPAPGEM